MRHILLLGAATTALALAAASANAYTLSYGGTRATACYTAANNGDGSDTALQTCDRALSEDALAPADRAKTLVNRGSVYMARGLPERAMRDFDAALAIDASNADARSNRGVALLGLHQYQQAIAELSQGITMQPSRPERIHFARARAYEEMGDIRSAYADYREAAALAPGWEQARLELSRFRVRGG